MCEYLVTVLVTFYNQEEFVDNTLKCVFDQVTDFNFKVIVGDDGSSDGTVNKAEKWKEKYPDRVEIYVMPREPGKQIPGFRASRNRLNILRKVNTKYFTFLDGDDFYSNNNKLQIQFDLLENTDNQDCICCGHDMEALLPDGTKQRYLDANISEGKYTAYEYWKKYYVSAETMLFRSSIIDKLNIELLDKQYNDNMITLSALQFGKLYYIPQCMYVYRQTGKGVWSTGNMIANNIRNMYLYDLSIKLDHKLKNAADIRFSVTWRGLYKLRKSINAQDYVPYVIEAEEKGFNNSYLWLNYNNLSISKKMYLFCNKLLTIIKYKIYGVELRLFGRK